MHVRQDVIKILLKKSHFRIPFEINPIHQPAPDSDFLDAQTEIGTWSGLWAGPG